MGNSPIGKSRSPVATMCFQRIARNRVLILGLGALWKGICKLCKYWLIYFFGYTWSFDCHASTTTALMKAHQKLLLAHHSRPSFQNNLLLAYNILHKQKSKHYNLNDATIITCKPQLSQTPWLSGLILLSHFNFMNIGKSAWRSDNIFVCSSFRIYLWVSFVPFFPFQREKVALAFYTLNIYRKPEIKFLDQLPHGWQLNKS